LTATTARKPEDKGAAGIAFRDTGNLRRLEVVIKADTKPCACYNAKFRSIAGKINSYHLTYPSIPLDSNSNSVAYTFLHQAGLTAPTSLPSGRYAPGLGTDLIDNYMPPARYLGRR